MSGLIGRARAKQFRTRSLGLLRCQWLAMRVLGIYNTVRLRFAPLPSISSEITSSLIVRLLCNGWLVFGSICDLGDVFGCVG